MGWLCAIMGVARKKPAAELVVRPNAEFEDKIVRGGWHDWMSSPPLSHDIVEIYRKDWDSPGLCIVADMHPATNVWGLYWRPCGAVIVGRVE